MKKENGNDMPFKADEVNWDELSGIGIMKDELELSGEMDTLLRGEKTKVMSLSLVLLGVDVVMDATLQLVRKGEFPATGNPGSDTAGQIIWEQLSSKPMSYRRFLSSAWKTGNGLIFILQYDSNHRRKAECRHGHCPCSRG